MKCIVCIRYIIGDSLYLGSEVYERKEIGTSKFIRSIGVDEYIQAIVGSIV